MSSTQQSPHESPRLYGHLPSWTTGHDLDQLVVRDGLKPVQHKPDLTADEPAAACGTSATNDYQASEEDSGLKHCNHQKCFGVPEKKQTGGPPQRALDAASDHDQLDLTNPRWSD